MIGRTLFIYIAWRFTKSLIAMMLLLLFLIVTVDFVEGLRKVGNSADISAGKVYLISLYTAPYFIDKAFPFACLFASMITLFQLNNKMELVVARAAGVSVWQFLMPMAAAAIIVGIFASTVYNPVAINFYEKSLDMKAELFGAKAKTNSKKAGGFWLRQQDADGSTIINAKLARKRGTLLTGVRFIRFDQTGTIYERIEAESAIHRGTYWLLVDVSKSGADQKVIKLESLEIPSNISSDYLLGASGDSESTGFWDLRNAAETVRLSGLNHLPYLVQFQSLLALPFFLVAMVIIAATVSLRFVRSGQGARLVLGGVLGGFMLYALTRLVTSFGGSGIVSPVVAAWSPLIVAILFGMSILLHQEDG